MPTQRSIEMKNMFESGQTLKSIAHQYGISRQRVHQILSANFTISRYDGGASLKAKEASKKIKIVKENRFYKHFGCSKIEYNDIVWEYGSSLPIAYSQQKSNAKKRNIEWHFNFYSWVKFWESSRKLEKRGLGKGLFVMCRFGDIGPYSALNCYIATQSQNAKDYYHYFKGPDMAPKQTEGCEKPMAVK